MLLTSVDNIITYSIQILNKLWTIQINDQETGIVSGKVNYKIIKPGLVQILEDYYVHHHFHDIITDYMIPSNELIQEVIEA